MPRRWLIAAALATGVAVSSAQPVFASRPLDTAMNITAPADLARVRTTGATFVRLQLSWPAVAPTVEPSSWDPSDPADPNYQWGAFDALVRAAAARGPTPYVTVLGSPVWAQTKGPRAPEDAPAGTQAPDPVAFGQFEEAVAARYSGGFQGLPRVRYFEAWNEENITTFLAPQLVDGKPVSPGWYRSMLNAFADAVHAVHPDNVVVMGGLAPFIDGTLSVIDQYFDWGPLSFLRALLCVDPAGKPTCKTRVDFDVLAIHPYTSGGPTHHALHANDVSLGDLAKLRAVVAAAGRAGHLSRRNPGLWVTEFSWDSNPPDPHAVPTALEARWVAEALYRMWLNKVSLVTWFRLTDEPLATSPYQSGLLYISGKPKPALRAFRFPFVALPERDECTVWGRTPAGELSRVLVEQTTRGGWTIVARLTPDRHGIFEALLRAPQNGRMRARIISPADTSVPYGLAAVPDRFVNPFGGVTPDRAAKVEVITA